MRCLVLVVILAVIGVPVAAPQITYVAQNPSYPTDNCVDLVQPDLAFCERLSLIGYDIRFIPDIYVLAEAAEWQSAAEAANMIFLGNVSTRMAGEDRANFCGNIAKTAKPIFATFLNAYIGDGLRGCAFDILPVEYPDNNTCLAYPPTFRKIRDGYITAMIPTKASLQENVTTIYKESAVVKLHGDRDIFPGLGWIGVSCDPAGALAGVYSVINTSEAGVFWGLDRPDLFGETAWKLFDRTVWEVLGETAWVINIFTIPQRDRITANSTFWLIANVTWRGQPVESGILNFSDTIRGNLSHIGGGFWRNDSMILPKSGSFSFQLTGIDPENILRGAASGRLEVGTLVVDILSGDYVPGQEYEIRANITRLTAGQRADVSYKIWNTSDWTVLVTGKASLVAGTRSLYGGTVSENVTKAWVGDLVLEVTAHNATYPDVGGGFRVIRIAAPLTGTIVTDKPEYQPGEKIKLNFTVPEPPPNVIAAYRTITDPAGQDHCEANRQMKKDGTLFTVKDCSLPADAAAGNWIINVSFTDGVRWNWTAKTIKVKPYDIELYKNGASFVADEELRLTVEISNSYTAAINFSLVANLTDPNETVWQVGKGEIMCGDGKCAISPGKWEVSWTVPTTAPGGLWTATIYVTDNWTRSLKLEDEFMILTAGVLNVTPRNWLLSVTAPDVYRKNFTITNTGTTTLHNITIRTNITAIELSRSYIATLAAGKSAGFSANWSAVTYVNLSGSIIVKSNETPAFIIPVQLSYAAELWLPQQLSVDPDYNSTVILPNMTFDTAFTLTNDADILAEDIDVEIGDGLAGIVSVKSKPSTIEAGETASLVLTVDTTGLEPNIYSDIVSINSSVGAANITLSLTVIGDLAVAAFELEAELEEIMGNLSVLQEQGHNVTALLDLHESISERLDEVKDAWDGEDWDAAYAAFTAAEDDLGELQRKVAKMQELGPPPGRYGGVIWAIAIVIILTIIAVTVWKFKDKIKELIYKILGKKPPEKKEEVPEEYYYPEYREERYRVEYY
jgi:hypothetical protein